MPDVQKAIQAMLQALNVPARDHAAGPRRVICISRDYGAGGDELAKLLAERLGLEVYDHQILDRIATRLDSDPNTMKALDTAARELRDLWLYSLVTGEDLSEDAYKRHLVNVVVSIGRTGGVILGAGAHLILARSGALRVRCTGSPDIRAQRVAATEGLSLDDAAKKIEEVDHTRGKFVWDHFHQRLNDPHTFDIVLNTDRMRHPAKGADLLMTAIGLLDPVA